MDSSFTTSDGARIHYRLCGSGFPIVFLHGNNLSMDYFLNQLELAEHYQLLLIDSREQGQSTQGRKPVSFRQMAEDLEDLLQYLKIDSCIIVGHSDGANLALLYSYLYPDRIRGIVANGGNISFDGLSFLTQIGVWLEEKMYSLLAHLIPSLERRARVAQLLLQDVLSFSSLAQISCPCLILLGQWDLVKLSHSQEIVKNLPLAEIKIIRRTGHNPARRKIQEFNHIIIQFVESVRKKGEKG
ncbi:alpha/beta fold hydrolase [Streptococcus suis]|uniref:alpha/beta fold hydrolase n=1 Tax=Streptococcus suis TaxID=1307 RepID=UPI00041C0A64|nr:alpha/beta hydrolase [Streptococcus suis]